MIHESTLYNVKGNHLIYRHLDNVYGCSDIAVLEVYALEHYTMDLLVFFFFCMCWIRTDFL